jgi:hypothetical protein
MKDAKTEKSSTEVIADLPASSTSSKDNVPTYIIGYPGDKPMGT